MNQKQLDALGAEAGRAIEAHKALVPALYTNWQGKPEIIATELQARWAMQRAVRIYKAAYKKFYAEMEARELDCQREKSDNSYPGSN
jgi:hypothetical protein